jgi:ornithine cyclodeaminase/alanine dehydrogenase-like protein (mu-crystallin family)
MHVRRIRRVYAYDRDPARALQFVKEMTPDTALDIESVEDLSEAIHNSDICVTCTPAREPLVGPDDLRPGQFIAAVGADSEGKQELRPEVLRNSLVVVDIVEQAAAIGELHHAIAAGLMRVSDVHADLGQLVTGRRQGRTAASQVFVFDSTGTALQDVAAAAMVYERALQAGCGRVLPLGA